MIKWGWGDDYMTEFFESLNEMIRNTNNVCISPLVRVWAFPIKWPLQTSLSSKWKERHSCFAPSWESSWCSDIKAIEIWIRLYKQCWREFHSKTITFHTFTKQRQIDSSPIGIWSGTVHRSRIWITVGWKSANIFAQLLILFA